MDQDNRASVPTANPRISFLPEVHEAIVVQMSDSVGPHTLWTSRDLCSEQ